MNAADRTTEFWGSGPHARGSRVAEAAREVRDTVAQALPLFLMILLVLAVAVTLVSVSGTAARTTPQPTRSAEMWGSDVQPAPNEMWGS